MLLDVRSERVKGSAGQRLQSGDAQRDRLQVRLPCHEFEEITRRDVRPHVTGDLLAEATRPPASRRRFDRFGSLADGLAESRIWTLALILVTAGSAFVLLYLGRDLTFYGDEWTFIDERPDPSVNSWLRPHSEHWATTVVVVYQLLVRLVGLQSYTPYLGLLILIHAVAVWGIYRLVSHVADRITGFAAAIVVMLLGPAFEDLSGRSSSASSGRQQRAFGHS